MIHYHCADIGGGPSERSRFYFNRHLFVSYARPDVLQECSNLCSSFAIDNGAYSIWKNGGQLNIDEYKDFVKQWSRHPACDFHIIPDVIDGSENENAMIIQLWHEPHAVPVWHLNESLRWLDILVRTYDRIAIGSSGEYATIGNVTWMSRMKEVFKTICDAEGRPRTKVHGFRMLDPKIFTMFPFSSCDSSNAAVNSGAVKRFGMYAHHRRDERGIIIADLVERFQSPPVFKDDGQESFL